MNHIFLWILFSVFKVSSTPLYAQEDLSVEWRKKVEYLSQENAKWKSFSRIWDKVLTGDSTNLLQEIESFQEKVFEGFLSISLLQQEKEGLNLYEYALKNGLSKDILNKLYEFLPMSVRFTKVLSNLNVEDIEWVLDHNEWSQKEHPVFISQILEKKLPKELVEKILEKTPVTLFDIHDDLTPAQIAKELGYPVEKMFTILVKQDFVKIDLPIVVSSVSHYHVTQDAEKRKRIKKDFRELDATKDRINVMSFHFQKRRTFHSKIKNFVIISISNYPFVGDTFFHGHIDAADLDQVLVKKTDPVNDLCSVLDRQPEMIEAVMPILNEKPDLLHNYVRVGKHPDVLSALYQHKSRFWQSKLGLLHTHLIEGKNPEITKRLFELTKEKTPEDLEKYSGYEAIINGLLVDKMKPIEIAELRGFPHGL